MRKRNPADLSFSVTVSPARPLAFMRCDNRSHSASSSVASASKSLRSVAKVVSAEMLRASPSGVTVRVSSPRASRHSRTPVSP